MNPNTAVQLERSGNTPPLNTMNAKSLLSSKLPPVRYIVEELLPQGLHVLAGPPKIGKSYLTLWLCLQIAEGKPVWEMETHACGVLYITLEDTPERIRKRILEMSETAPENLHLATSSSTISEGLPEQLDAFLAEYPDTGLIAIDTLQKVRSAEATQSSSYAIDYMALSKLKEIADKRKIAILMIHHLRKQKSSDPFEMISGTTGITGAVDASFVMMQRRELKRVATLLAQGRDVAYQEIDIRFRNSVWELVERRTPEELGDDEEIPGIIFQTVMLLKGNGGFEGSASELLFMLEEKSIAANVLSRILKNYADVLEEHGFRLRFHRSGHKRMVYLTPIPGYVETPESLLKLTNGREWAFREMLDSNYKKPMDDDDDDENGGGIRHDDTSLSNSVMTVTEGKESSPLKESTEEIGGEPPEDNGLAG